MMFNNIFYKKSPILIQNVYISLLALVKLKMRTTKEVNAITAELISHDRDNEALATYVKNRIEKVLSNGVNNVAFYSHETVSENKIGDFKYISKVDVRNNKKAFLNLQSKERVFEGQTSGTTGAPLTIYQDLNSIRMERSFADRQRIWAGYKEGDRRAWLRGDVIVPAEQDKLPFWRYSYFEDMILLSSFHMTVAALPLYIQAMVDYDVDVIQAYPSSIVTLAKYLESNNEYYPAKLKSIMTSSESLSVEDKKLVEERFKCTVFDWYGLFERVAAIGSCEHGRYHILTDYSHVELLPAGEVDGKQRAEIVGTNFNNTLYPLIRYKTGDHVILSNEKNCPCGRVYPVVDSIEGRVGDYLIAQSGQKIHILNHIPKGVKGLIASQFIQEISDEIIVLVVVNRSDFSDKEAEKLTKNVQERLGSNMKVIIKEVTSIPRTKNGKVKQAICNIKD